jgi:predicted metal-binding membrane protein
VRTPVLAITALGWLVTAVLLADSGASHVDHDSMNMAMGTSVHRQAMSTMPTHLAADSLLGFAGMWLVMLTAMMSPVLIAPLRHLGARSLPRLRLTARGLFVAAYATLWSIAGLLLLALADLLDRLGAPIALAAGLAVLWQLTPVKQRCLNGHHSRPPLAAFNRSAQVSAVRFGARLALWCIGSCWTLMLLPLVLASHQLAAMAAVTVWIWAEQLEFPALARWRVRVPTRAILVARVAVTRLVQPRPAQS